jgi:3-dehydroquinate dehydratase-2
MRILVLYGPNLNLLGWVMRRTSTRLTLDKLNRALRSKAGELGVELKIFQSQSEADASMIVQRQRNKVAGIFLVPGIWAQMGYLLRETVEISGLPLAVFHLAPELGPWRSQPHSVFKDITQLEETGIDASGITAFLENFVSRLTS